MKIRMLTLCALALLLVTVAVSTQAEESASLIGSDECADAGTSLVIGNPDDAETPVWLSSARAVGNVETRFEGGKKISSQEYVIFGADGAAIIKGELKCESECKKPANCQVKGCIADKANLTCTPCVCEKKADAANCSSSVCKYCKKTITVPIDL